MTSVNLEVGSSHEAGGIADEKDRRTSVLFRRTQFAEHVLRRPVTSPLWILLKQRFHHGRNDIPGGDGVHADPMFAPLGGEIPCELQNTGLGCIVR